MSETTCVEDNKFTLEEAQLCVTALECAALEPRHYAYARMNDCSITPPEENGGFILTEGYYQCKDINEYLEVTGEKRRCVDAITCQLTLSEIATITRLCISADDWLTKNPTNYISLNIGFTYEGADLPTDPTKLCSLWWNAKDSIFVGERICGCPTDDAHKYVLQVKGDNGVETMCTDSSKLGEDDLELQIKFKAADNDYVVYRILSSDDCK